MNMQHTAKRHYSDEGPEARQGRNLLSRRMDLRPELEAPDPWLMVCLLTQSPAPKSCGFGVYLLTIKSS